MKGGGKQTNQTNKHYHQKEKIHRTTTKQKTHAQNPLSLQKGLICGSSYKTLRLYGTSRWTCKLSDTICTTEWIEPLGCCGLYWCSKTIQIPALAFSECKKPEEHEKFQTSSMCLCLSLLNWYGSEMDRGSWEKQDGEGRVCHRKSSVSPYRNVVHREIPSLTCCSSMRWQ